MVPGFVEFTVIEVSTNPRIEIVPVQPTVADVAPVNVGEPILSNWTIKFVLASEQTETW